MRVAQAMPVVEVVAGARVPGLTGLEGDVEDHTPVGKLRLRVSVEELKDDAAVKFAVGVGRPQLAALGRSSGSACCRAG